MTQRLFIFDLDGTLADTIGSLQEAVNLTMSYYGYPQRNYEEIRLAIGGGAKELIRRSLPKEAAQDEELVSRVLTRYNSFLDQVYDHLDGCYDGVKESVLALRDAGHVLAVLSNKQDYYTKKIIEMLFPENPFSFVQGQTELPKKPDPTVPRMIMERLGFPPERTLFVGDSDVDMLTAHNAGMTAVGCAWGYRDEAVLRAAGADILLQEGRELAKL